MVTPAAGTFGNLRARSVRDRAHHPPEPRPARTPRPLRRPRGAERDLRRSHQAAWSPLVRAAARRGDGAGVGRAARPSCPRWPEPVTSAPARPLVTAPPPAPPFLQRTAEPPPVARPAAGTVGPCPGPAPSLPAGHARDRRGRSAADGAHRLRDGHAAVGPAPLSSSSDGAAIGADTSRADDRGLHASPHATPPSPAPPQPPRRGDRPDDDVVRIAAAPTGTWCPSTAWRQPAAVRPRESARRRRARRRRPPAMAPRRPALRHRHPRRPRSRSRRVTHPAHRISGTTRRRRMRKLPPKSPPWSACAGCRPPWTTAPTRPTSPHGRSPISSPRFNARRSRS